MLSVRLAILICALAIAGCATDSRLQDKHIDNGQAAGVESAPAAQTSSNPAKNGPKGETDQNQNSNYINVTPFSTIRVPKGTSSSGAMAGTYTRLVITNVDGSSLSGSGATIVAYRYRDRGMWARFFSPKTTSVNFSVKVADGSFVATVPLLTVDHVSNSSDGEGFQRIVTHQVETYPLFLVKADGSNAKFSSQFLLKGASQYQGPISGAISATQNAIKLVAPKSGILTTLTEKTVSDSATALDNVIAKLLTTSIDEEHFVDEDIGIVHASTGIRVTLQIPTAEDEGNWDGHSGTVGQWTLTFAAPRPSIFSDIEVCDPKGSEASKVQASRSGINCDDTLVGAAKRAQGNADMSPAEVLGFQLVSGTQSLGTVSSFLKAQSWYATSQKALLAAKPKSDDVVSFCAQVKQAMIAAGLNSVDAGIVSHAMEHETWATEALRSEMKSHADVCGVYYR